MRDTYTFNYPDLILYPCTTTTTSSGAIFQSPFNSSAVPPDFNLAVLNWQSSNGKSVAKLVNRKLSILIMLDKKLNWWYRLVYYLAGFKYYEI